jgi:hypothetical protein
MMSGLKRKLLFVILMLAGLHAAAQEFECKISVSAPRLEGTDKRVFESMQKSLYEFMNNRKWSSYSLKNEERLDCTILLTITERLGSDEYRGTLNVVLRRPVFNTAYNTPVLNYLDKDFMFTYVEFQPLDYSEGSYTNNLVSVFAFYAYILLGFEFDTFVQDGGKQYFQQAQGVVSAAQSSSDAGWKGYESQRNRYWLAENMSNPSNQALHDFLYKYHRQGLDMMYEKLDIGRGNITESLDYLKSLYNSKPDLYCITVILDAKRDEFVNIYSDSKVPPMEKTSVANLLKEIDPANSSKYQAILSK